MKLKEILIARDKKSKELAVEIGTDEPMISKFANYKCLPIPTDMDAICKALKCSISDIYTDSEIVYSKKNGAKKSAPKDETKYSLHVLLPIAAKKVLTKSNLKKYGYKNLTHWVWCCYKELLIEMKKKSCPKSKQGSSSAKHIAPEL